MTSATSARHLSIEIPVILNSSKKLGLQKLALSPIALACIPRSSIEQATSLYSHKGLHYGKQCYKVGIGFGLTSSGVPAHFEVVHYTIYLTTVRGSAVFFRRAVS